MPILEQTEHGDPIEFAWMPILGQGGAEVPRRCLDGQRNQGEVNKCLVRKTIEEVFEISDFPVNAQIPSTSDFGDLTPSQVDSPFENEDDKKNHMSV
ncbi:hypothetical protein NPIL_487741 [Nephila pilipes]|uniref:Uncharacterized protein n=1 Tax=Nephila pilipes TaxID=299642 RepID=A0A8X6UBR0_NEPPI|nr:hypothetical protein NPIL_487741 [Nephila pilipes]